MIEVKLAFPELDGAEGPLPSVAECFRQMVIAQPGSALYCRVRMEAKWTRGTLPEGDVDEQMWWITTADQDVGDANKHRMNTHERNRIHAVYVPASRYPAKQLRYVSGTLLGRLLRAIAWSEESQDVVAAAAEQVRQTFEGEAGVVLVHEKVGEIWGLLHDTAIYANPRLRPIADELVDILRQIELVFRPGEDGTEHALERLSEGMRLAVLYGIGRVSCGDRERSLRSHRGNCRSGDTHGFRGRATCAAEPYPSCHRGAREPLGTAVLRADHGPVAKACGKPRCSSSSDQSLSLDCA